ncbi:MAG: transcriptional repressor, partial [Micromonosporaceae bacterium]|nr:transcriptional repressor [Micromonosporaceae bacterium]
VRLPDGEQVYRRCARSNHHHHLVCRVCGRTVEVEGPAVERWARQQAEQHGFTEVDHTVEILGTCASCAAG